MPGLPPRTATIHLNVNGLTVEVLVATDGLGEQSESAISCE
jgi:hypothetical protein